MTAKKNMQTNLTILQLNIYIYEYVSRNALSANLIGLIANYKLKAKQ